MGGINGYGLADLPSGWRWDYFENLCSKVSVGHVGETSSLFTDREKGVPLIRSQNVRPGKLVLDDIKFVTNEFHCKSEKSQLHAGDILIVRVGQNRGDCCVLPKNTGDINCANIVFGRLKNLKFSNYIGYFFNSVFGRASLLAVSTGSAQEVLNTKAIAKVIVPVPPEDVAEDIGERLAGFDNKIELNRKTNETLEAMAQALFKSWFVDFDPVIDNTLAAGNDIPEPLKAKAATRQAFLAKNNSHKTLPDNIRKLFPNEFEFTEEMGWVPKGWEMRNLPEVIDFLEGPGIRNWQYTEAEDGIKFINIRCIKNGDLTLETANKLTRKEALGKYLHFQLAVDDIVISTSGTLGRFAFVRAEHLPLSLNTSVIRFRKIEGVSTLHYISGYSSTRLQWELQTRATGSVQLNFGPMHLKKINMLLPPFEILEKHSELAELYFRKRQRNLRNIENLTKLRDTLLPKLLSGELRIPDAEKFIENIA